MEFMYRFQKVEEISLLQKQNYTQVGGKMMQIGKKYIKNCYFFSFIIIILNIVSIVLIIKFY